MKRILLTFLLVLLLNPAGQTQPASTPDYLELIDQALYIEYAEMKMEVYKNEKLLKYYRMELYRRGEKMRMEFLEPAVEKGRRMLNEETSLWMYMPRTSKVMKLPLKQAFMGSDASNRDLMRMAFRKDYTLTGQQKGEGGLLLLELEAKDLSVSYHKVVIAFDTVRKVPVRQEMYSLSDKHIKTMEYEYVKLSGEYIPSECIIRDELMKSSVTRMYYNKVKRTNNKPEVFFTLGSLKQ